jgi:hypothetical protein
MRKPERINIKKEERQVVVFTYSVGWRKVVGCEGFNEDFMGSYLQ